MFKMVPITALVAAAIVAQPALAADDNATRSTTVKVADLDLSSDAGKAEMSARVTRAAREVCDANNHTAPIGQWVAAQHCAAVTAKQTIGRQKSQTEMLAQQTSTERKGG